MSSVILSIIGFVVAIIGITARIIFWRSGRDKEKLKNAEQSLKDIAKANNAASTDAHDNELRDKYNIK